MVALFDLLLHTHIYKHTAAQTTFKTEHPDSRLSDNYYRVPVNIIIRLRLNILRILHVSSVDVYSTG